MLTADNTGTFIFDGNRSVQATRLWRHAARRPRGIWSTWGSCGSTRRVARSGGQRHKSPRHQRLLRTAHH